MLIGPLYIRNKLQWNSCRNSYSFPQDNEWDLQCHQWWQSWHYDDSQFSMTIFSSHIASSAAAAMDWPWPRFLRLWYCLHYRRHGPGRLSWGPNSITIECRGLPVSLSLMAKHCSWNNLNTLWPRQNGRHFRRRHFQMHFLEWKCMNFDWNFTEVCSWGSNWQYSIISSDNGLAPTRQQAIIWANVDIIHRHLYVSLGLNELTCWGLNKMAVFPRWQISDTFTKRNFCISIQISSLFLHFLGLQLTIRSAVAGELTWRWTGDKPLPEFSI